MAYPGGPTKITRSESVVGGGMEMRVWSYVDKGPQA